MESEDIRAKYEKLAEFLNENSVTVGVNDNEDVQLFFSGDSSPHFLTLGVGDTEWTIDDV